MGWGRRIVCGQGNSYHFTSSFLFISHPLIMGAVRLVLLALLVFAASFNIPESARGEIRGSVKGRVTDAQTGAPLANTNVYLSSTTIGTNTGPDGAYTLPNIPRGIYQIVASRVGHRVKSSSLHVSNADTLGCDFALEPVTLQGEEVQVLAHVDTEWRRRLAEFTRAFIGEGENSSGCTILNPEVLEFRIEKGTNILIAATDSVLRIQNRTLGYTLYARLGVFEWDLDIDEGKFVLYPRFEKILSADEAELETWRSNRLKSYHGSLKHFLASLVAGRLEQEGFSVSTGALMELRGGKFHPLSPDDYSLVEVPGEPLWTLSFRRWFRVDYRGEDTHLKSYIGLTRETAILDDAGNLVDPLCIQVIGDWTGYRVAEMLPLNKGD